MKVLTPLSVLSRVNYDYKGKYLISLTARRDGSSRFGKDRKWGTFPAASLGYNISEEDFFEPLKGVLVSLKLKQVTVYLVMLKLEII